MDIQILHRFPNEPIQVFSGSTLQHSGEESFVLSDFEQKNVLEFFGETSQDLTRIDWQPNTRTSPCPEPNKEEYLFQIETLTQELELGEKAVIARAFPYSCSVEPQEIFTQLEKQHPSAFVYLFQLSNQEMWMGASPERLIEQKGPNLFQTVSLAGTKWNKNKDWTPKEEEEQFIVTQEIERKLSLGNARTIMVGERSTQQAGHLFHLSTPITFEADQDQLKSIIQHLHPTAAVCGFPKDKSLQQIGRFETQSRSWYAGFLGRFSENKTDLFVNLRCAQVLANSLITYAGGGITALSNAQQEWDEIVQKSQTIPNAINHD
ncbi:MAG: isochorismate synthase [Luteibaculaceae bacterium]|jgi:isochorismate synthase